MFSKLFTGITGCLIFSNSIISGNGLTPQNNIPGVPAVYRGIWSVMANPAGNAETSVFSAGVSYQSVFLMKQLSAQGFVFSLPLKKALIISASYRQFGYSLYKEQITGLAFSKAFGASVSAGVRFDYLSTKFGNDYGKTSAFTGSAGILARITESLRLGVCVFNPQRTKMSKNGTDRYPVIMQAGVSWSFGNATELQFGISKSGNTKAILQCALQYHVSSRFQLYAGISNGYEPFSMGYSFRFHKLEIGMSSGYHYWLGFSPRFLLTFKNK